MCKPAFEIVKGVNDLYFFYLSDENGNALLSSPGFSEKKDCDKAIASLPRILEQPNIARKVQVKSGQVYFDIKVPQISTPIRSRLFKNEATEDIFIADISDYIQSADYKVLTWA